MNTQTKFTTSLASHASANSLTLGVGMMLVAFLCFSIMDASAKWLVTASLAALQIAFMRYFVHLVCVLLIYAPAHLAPRHRGTQSVKRLFRAQQPWHLALRSFLLLAATMFNFTALVYLPLNLTIAIFNAAPFVICLMSIPLLGERVGARRFTAVLVGFVGVLIILNPAGEFFVWPTLLAISALLCASGYFVMNRMVAGNDGNAVTQLYAAGLGSLVLAPIAWSQWVWPDSITGWILFLVMGTLGMLGHTLLRAAHTYAEASSLAPTVYSQIIYITFISWWLFDTTPDLWTLIGTLTIVGSGLYLWARERQIRRRENNAEQGGPVG